MELKDIEDLFVLREYPKGSMIILEEDYVDKLFIIKDFGVFFYIIEILIKTQIIILLKIEISLILRFW